MAIFGLFFAAIAIGLGWTVAKIFKRLWLGWAVGAAVLGIYFLLVIGVIIST